MNTMSETNHYNYKSGYMALTATILLSLSLVLVVTAVSFQGFTTRFIVLNTELKAESDYLAESCFEVAKLKLAKDNAYVGNETISLADKQCRILSVTGPEASKRIRTTASVQEAISNLEVVVDVTTQPLISVTSWTEVPSF